MQAPDPCCGSRREAASRGHYDCYNLRLQRHPEGSNRYLDLYRCLAAALRHGNEDFAKRLLAERQVIASDFSNFCAVYDEEPALSYMLRTAPAPDLRALCDCAARRKSLACLRMLLDMGAPWNPRSLLYAARDRRLDVVEVVLKHSKDWCPLLPSVAGAAGNVRFLMSVFDAGCPVWTRVQDGDPRIDSGGLISPALYIAGQHRLDLVQHWSLVASPDLVCSGPVLLLAAQKGAPLTLRMEGMLGEVRRRTLALAGCFHRAACLSRAPGAAARKWDAMGRVPVEIVQSIATLARLSIVAVDLVM
jgi:hypothetical protein